MKQQTLIKALTITGFFVVLGIWQIWNVLSEHYPIVNFPPKGDTIVALGDSLTVGVGASSPEMGFVPILEERLGITIINKGMSGDTTTRALLRLDEVLALHPDIVMILLGGNDYLQKVPQEETFKNLRSIIKQIQGGGSTVLLVGIQGGLLNDKFEKDFSVLAKETGSLFVPNVLDHIIGDPKLMSDQVHPNDAGYLRIADKIAPTLEGIVLARTGASTAIQGTSTTRTDPSSE